MNCSRQASGVTSSDMNPDIWCALWLQLCRSDSGSERFELKIERAELAIRKRYVLQRAREALAQAFGWSEESKRDLFIRYAADMYAAAPI